MRRFNDLIASLGMSSANKILTFVSVFFWEQALNY
jgi:hypothetical protein